MSKRIYIALAAALTIGRASADADITGRVTDRSTGNPLDYASVSLVDAATGRPTTLGTFTDTEGRFLIANAPSGRYLVRVSMVGCVSQEREATVADTPVDLGQIDLTEDSKLLQEVVVTGRQNQMKVDTERRVWNVRSNLTSAGASAQELLSAVPSVDVSSDGNIALRGKSDVMVLIDGKEMGMTADTRSQMLRQIPAENIESIEVMTNPGARHTTEGTAGIINIKLRRNTRHGYFGSADANIDTRGGAGVNATINFNEGHFETTAGLGLKSNFVPGGRSSVRLYDGDNARYLNSLSRSSKRDNSVFLRFGTTYRPDSANSIYVSAIATFGHKRGFSDAWHSANLPRQWAENHSHISEHGNTRGVNLLAGFRHTFAAGHHIDINATYNTWAGPTDNLISEELTHADGTTDRQWQNQHQDVKISNWEAAADYTVGLAKWLRLDAGFKGNYSHENSPAAYAGGPDKNQLEPLDNLYNRFKYNTDITALYLNLSGSHNKLNFAAGLRGEWWTVDTRSLGFGQTDADVAPFKKHDFALFPSASAGWTFDSENELKLSYTRRIRRPFGPQLNTFENIADPSEVHLGNPLIQAEYSNSLELTYLRQATDHMLSVTAYMRASNDMISHVSFLAPMTSDPTVNTMYYGHANVGNMVNTGIEIISRNTLFQRLTLTTTLNIANSHLKAWRTDYPLHNSFYTIQAPGQDRLVYDLSCMASLKLPWNLTFQTTARYSSRRVEAQGISASTWDVEAGLRRAFGSWTIGLVAKDIFGSKRSRDILYGNGYTQSINKWTEGRSFRLSVAYTFGKSHSHDEHSGRHQHINTGGYGDDAHNH